MKRSLFATCIFAWWMLACHKAETVHTPVPFLTDKIWTLDTITINPPASYNQLSPSDQIIYNRVLGWEKTAEIKFNENGTVECGGNWDFGYYKWRLIHNNLDIEVQLTTGTKDTLFNWAADNQQFTYLRSYSPSFTCTLVYH